MGAAPCCRFTTWDSFATYHFAALVVEKVSSLQLLHQSKDCKSFVPKGWPQQEFSLWMMSVYLTWWSVQSSDSHTSSPATSGYQWVATLQQLVPLWLWSRELAVLSEVAWLSRYLPSGAQARPQPSICCHFHAGAVDEGYHWLYPAFTCETSQVCQPVDLLQADCKPQCHFHSPPKVNKSSSPSDGKVELTQAPGVPLSWTHWEQQSNAGDRSGEQSAIPGVSRLEALKIPEHLLVSGNVCVSYKLSTVYS